MNIIDTLVVVKEFINNPIAFFSIFISMATVTVIYYKKMYGIKNENINIAVERSLTKKLDATRRELEEKIKDVTTTFSVTS